MHARDVSEEDLVRVLQWAMRCKDLPLLERDASRREEAFRASGGSDSGAASWVVSSPPQSRSMAAVENFVLLVVSCPRSDTLVQRSLAMLLPEEAAMLLAVLKRMMWFYSSKSIQTLPPCKYYVRPPSLAMTLDWINIVVACHFPRLLLLAGTDARLAKMLSELVDSVRIQLSTCDASAALRGSLSLLEERVRMPKPLVPDYQLQMMHV
jgi:hypothetical protein